MSYKTLFLLCILGIINVGVTKAQFVEIGGFGGVFSFNGDVNEGDVIQNTNVGFGGFLRYNVHPRFSVTLGFVKGTIEATDKSSQWSHIRERNLSFTSESMEFSLIPEFNILPFYPLKSSQVFAPYIGLGIAVLTFNPTTKFNGEIVELQSLGTEGQGIEGYAKPYDLYTFAIPMLFGIKYSIGGRINIGLEVGYRFTFTDYIDDVSTIYLSPKQLEPNGSLAVSLSNRTEEYTGVPANELIGSRRGNSNNNDGYLLWGLRLSFSLYTKKSFKKKEFKYKLQKWL